MTQSYGGAEAPGLQGSGDLRELALVALDRIYEAVEVPERLGAALGALARLAGAGRALLIRDGDHGQGSERQVVATSLALSTHGVLSPGHAASSEATRSIPLRGGFELVLDLDEIEPERLATLLRTLPHLSRALWIGERLAAEESQRVATGSALDRLACGVALLDGEGKIVRLNGAARRLIERRSGLEISSRRLVPVPPVSRARFDAFLERLAGETARDRRSVGGRLSVLADGEPLIDLLVAPLHLELDRTEVCAAVFLASAGEAPTLEELLVGQYGLELDAARVAVHLACGGEAAHVEGLGDEAVEELRRALFVKLGTTRQADLVRLMLRPPGVLFERATG